MNNWCVSSYISPLALYPSPEAFGNSPENNPRRVVIQDGNAFVVYESDPNHPPRGVAYKRHKRFPFRKSIWWMKRMTDREALEAAITYAKKPNAEISPYRKMANDIIEIQKIVGSL